jgi:hypothetical protein
MHAPNYAANAGLPLFFCVAVPDFANSLLGIWELRSGVVDLTSSTASPGGGLLIARRKVHRAEIWSEIFWYRRG